MSTLLAAVEAGSLSAASRKLGMPLATVSRKVSELETHLRTRLLHRTGRRLTLTGAGRAYVAACRRILDDIDAAERAAAGEYSAPRGDLIITAPIVFGRLHVLPVALDFLRTYPDIDIRLSLADHLVNLHEGRIDVALRIGELPDSSLVASRIGEIRRVVCASPRYLAEHGTPMRPQDLAAHHCITFEGLISPDVWTFPAGKAVTSVAIRSRLVVNTAEAAVDAAVATIGITRVLAYQAARAVRDRALAIVLKDFEPNPLPVSLVHAGEPMLPLKVRAFLDFAAPRLKTRLVQSAV